MDHITQVSFTEELHKNGGPGCFMLGKAEALLPSLSAAYQGQIQCIYMDLPFSTGETFHLKLSKSKKSVVIPAYSDKLSEEEYENWIRALLSGCRELLTESGSIYLHMDYRLSARLRLIMDEVFGKSNFVNEIIWSYKSGGRSTKHYPHKHDTILFYRKTAHHYFDITAVGSPRGPQRRNHMKRFVDENGRICFTIRSGGKVYTYYEDTPVYPTDVWTDIEHLQQRDKERTGYDTQKPEALLRRILLASSRPGDLVADFCSGSGTTAAVAAKLGRRYLAVDASPVAAYTLRKRQLANGSILNLLSGEHDMLFIYDNQPADVKAETETDIRNNTVHVRIHSVMFPDGYPPVYLALGTGSGSRFSPIAVDCDPQLPTSIEMPYTGQDPILQVVSAGGVTAFFRITLPVQN